MADIDDFSYLNNVGNEPEPEEDVVTNTPEPEEEPDAIEDEPEEDLESEEEPVIGKTEASEEEPAPRKRAETRIQKLANERATEREARIRAEAERDALLKYRQAAPTQDNSEAIRLRNEKLSLMEPHERALFVQNEELQQMKQHLQLAELRSEDRADKATYDAKALVDPRYARNKAAVEEKLRDFRSKGINATREQCLIQVIGEKMLNEKPRKGAREAAGQRVASVKGTPTTAKGTTTVAAGKGDGLGDLEARLRGKSFNEMFGN